MNDISDAIRDSYREIKSAFYLMRERDGLLWVAKRVKEMEGDDVRVSVFGIEYPQNTGVDYRVFFPKSAIIEQLESAANRCGDKAQELANNAAALLGANDGD